MSMLVLHPRISTRSCMEGVGVMLVAVAVSVSEGTREGVAVNVLVAGEAGEPEVAVAVTGGARMTGVAVKMDGVRVDIGVAGAYGMGRTTQPLQPESAKMIDAQANANRAIKPLNGYCIPSRR